MVSAVRRRAEAMSGGAGLIEGPLEGYHHETYVLWLPDGGGPVKVREPRSRVLWFDRRCFLSEEELLRDLRRYLPQVPEVIEVGDTGLQRFIVGRTLGAELRADPRVSGPVLEQIVGLFRGMAGITAEMLSARRRCSPADHCADGDSEGFLRRLVAFVRDEVYAANLERFGGLFHDLGIDDRTLDRLEERVSGLTSRPFSLLHADLHHDNLVIDPRGGLWAIDWELAMVGDPLYDLATHLYLHRYPADQERWTVREWCAAVEAVRPGASRGWQRDLPRITEFKRAQSAFTDVIRVAMSIPRESPLGRADFLRATDRLHPILRRAAEPLGMDEIADPVKIMRALIRWHARPDSRTTQS
ncbi:phosphotransferase [Streptomyces sp. CRN 30]|uniref:phosphotransferase n=1 Tax=Streptomyces sp. CRN 30 TaxID=3075613 RepID=UPI002A80CF89|nr:phosphotransferase [Streptomyces sp. CRN 30]